MQELSYYRNFDNNVRKPEIAYNGVVNLNIEFNLNLVCVADAELLWEDLNELIERSIVYE